MITFIFTFFIIVATIESVVVGKEDLTPMLLSLDAPHLREAMRLIVRVRSSETATVPFTKILSSHLRSVLDVEDNKKRINVSLKQHSKSKRSVEQVCFFVFFFCLFVCFCAFSLLLFFINYLFRSHSVINIKAGILPPPPTQRRLQMTSQIQTTPELNLKKTLSMQKKREITMMDQMIRHPNRLLHQTNSLLQLGFVFQV